MPEKTKIFLASSSELAKDREKFEVFIGRENSRLVEKGIYLELVIWENFLDAMSQTRLQDEYNNAIRDCEIFIMLYHTKVGKYTAEEFKTAFGHFRQTNRPRIFTYFKTAKVSLGDIPREHFNSLMDFQDELKQLGHFQTEYESTSDLLFHFKNQLDKLADEDFFHAEQKVVPPIPIPLSASPKGERMGMHHANTCDRVPQNTAFSNFYFNLHKQASRCHFFYLHGDRKQAHKSLFDRFTAKLKGIEGSMTASGKETEHKVIIKTLSFPNLQDEPTCRKGIVNKLMTSFKVPDRKKRLIEEQNIGTLLQLSPELKGVTAADYVCVWISIPHTKWKANLTPKVAQWFVTEFCCYETDAKLDLSTTFSEEIKTKVRQQLKEAPQFLFFFSIDFTKENKEIRNQISKALQNAIATQDLAELQPVEYNEIINWFDEYQEVWDFDTDAVDQTRLRYFPEIVQMDMNDIYRKLKQVINEINNPIEKNEFRNT